MIAEDKTLNREIKRLYAFHLYTLVRLNLVDSKEGWIVDSKEVFYIFFRSHVTTPLSEFRCDFFLLPAPIQRKFYNIRGAGDRTTVRHRLVSESTTDWLQVSFSAVLSLTVLLCLSWLLDSILCSDRWGEALCGLQDFEIIGASK